MTYITPPDFIEYDLERIVCTGLLTVLYHGTPVIAVERAGDAFWLRGRNGCVRTIIDRVDAGTQMDVCLPVMEGTYA